MKKFNQLAEKTKVAIKFPKKTFLFSAENQLGAERVKHSKINFDFFFSGWHVYGPENGYNFPYTYLLQVKISYFYSFIRPMQVPLITADIQIFKTLDSVHPPSRGYNIRIIF